MSGKPINVGYADVNYLSQSIMGIPVSDQTVSISGTSAQSSVLSSGRVYRMISDTDCHLEFGADPEAETTNYKLLADKEVYFLVPSYSPSVSMKVAVIQSSSSGTLIISKLDGVGEG